MKFETIGADYRLESLDRGKNRGSLLKNTVEDRCAGDATMEVIYKNVVGDSCKRGRTKEVHAR